MNGRAWTNEEIEFLTESWGTKTVPQIAKSINRTIDAVYVKAKRLGLRSIVNSSEYLTANQAARLLGVTDKTVSEYWIKKLGLTATKKKMVKSKYFIMIKLDNLVNFLKKNQDIWDSRRLELNGIGFEYEWLKEKRKKDNDLPPNSRKPYTQAEIEKIMFLYYKRNTPIEQIAEIMGRTKEAIKHRILKSVNELK